MNCNSRILFTSSEWIEIILRLPLILNQSLILRRRRAIKQQRILSILNHVQKQISGQKNSKSLKHFESIQAERNILSMWIELSPQQNIYEILIPPIINFLYFSHLFQPHLNAQPFNLDGDQHKSVPMYGNVFRLCLY